MAQRGSPNARSARRSGLARLALLGGGAMAWSVAHAGLQAAFVSGGVAAGVAARGGRGQGLRAEPAAAPATSPAAGESVALVKVTEESKMTTASLLGGFAGLLVGGVWVGGALFAATSYLARKEDDDLSKALKGVASGGLEVINFGAAMNEKYLVTDKLGSAITSALDGAKSGDSKEAATTVSGIINGVSDAVTSLDKDIGIKDTLGQLTTSASELAFQAVDKAVELNKEYKVTDQIAAKIEEATKSK
uniref:Uncharacterized protein n=1 Tax=Pyrodinium bahamense TaxID=73915 RepID=A0A7S0FYE4_9DINO